METELNEVWRPEGVEICADVIFIHGLDGDPWATWTAKGMEEFWPLWLGQDLGKVAVWSTGYSAWSSKWRGPSMRLPERAVNLAAYLEALGIGERPVIFICHSLGGLVAKQILFARALNSHTKNSVADAVRGVVFLSTPHTGSGIASVASFFRSIYRTGSVVRDLEDNEVYLRQLNDWYRSFAQKVNFRNLVMYETQKVKGVLVVDASSANPGIAGVNPIPVDANHEAICKPPSRQSFVYVNVVDFVRRLLAELDDHSAIKAAPLPTDQCDPGSPRTAELHKGSHAPRDYAEMTADQLLEAVRRERLRWEKGRIPEVFGESWFTALRLAVEDLGIRQRLTVEDYTWLLRGALYDGRIPPSMIPDPADSTIFDVTRYWLSQRSFRGPRYRSAILLERCTAPGRDEMVNAALEDSDYQHKAELSTAIRRGTTVAFIKDPRLSYDLDPEIDWDAKQRRYIVAFADRIRELDRARTARLVATGDESSAAATWCLAHLIALQYPWGEWSDRRTALESLIAERNPQVYAGVPKPNVARTLFALEALEGFNDHRLIGRRNRALSWLIGNVRHGWFMEWAEGQTPHSETRVPELVLRPDVRHTAQAITALCRWQSSRDPLASLVRSVSGSALDSGLWPNNRGGTTPRLLATVYAVEALGNIAYGQFRLPLADMLDRSEQALAKRALRRGISALLADCEDGDGLLGSSISNPSPYMTGLALFRLASLADKHPDIAQLVEMMIEGLSGSMGAHGWEDAATPTALRGKTRHRTTLRCTAGLARAAATLVDVPQGLSRSSSDFVLQIITSADVAQLDSPDYACATISLLAFRPDLLNRDVVSAAVAKAGELSAGWMARWLTDIEDVTNRFRALAELGLAGYREVLELHEERLRLLNGQ